MFCLVNSLCLSDLYVFLHCLLVVGFVDNVKLSNTGIRLLFLYFEAVNPIQYKIRGYSFISQVGFESVVLMPGSPWRDLFVV
jgi:hypothetical protein